MIPPEAVSSGSYYIVARTASGTWSDGTPVNIELTQITVSLETFNVFDVITVQWPANSVIYPVDVIIQGVLLKTSRSLGTVTSGTSLTAKVTLDHVSRGNYEIFLKYSYPSTIVSGYTDVKYVTALPSDPNLVAALSLSEAFVGFRYAFLSYLDPEALQSWNMSSVCQLCPACAQTSEVTNVWTFDVTFGSGGGDGFLIRRKSDGILVLSFEGTSTSDLNDYGADINYVQTIYPGCLEYSSSCKVHSGFFSRFNAYIPFLITALHEAIPPGADKSLHPILVVGHSLGGAVATFAAYELSLAGYLVTGVYTIGSPKVGNENFAVAWNLLVGRAIGELYNKVPSGFGPRRVTLDDNKNVTEDIMRPSLLLLEAMGLPDTSLKLPDEEFWLLWKERVSLYTERSRKLSSSIAGAGNANEPFRGTWRISNCGDIVSSLPFGSSFSHVDTLVQFDYRAPLSYDLNSNASCSNLSPSLGSHNQDSYLLALGGASLFVDSSYVVRLAVGGSPWVSSGSGVVCASISPSRTPSTSRSPSFTPTKTPSIETTASPSSSPLTSESLTETISPSPTSTFVITLSPSTVSTSGTVTTTSSPSDSITPTVTVSTSGSVTTISSPTVSATPESKVTSEVTSSPTPSASITPSVTLTGSPSISMSVLTASSVVITSSNTSTASSLLNGEVVSSNQGGKIGLTIGETIGISVGSIFVFVACIFAISVITTNRKLNARKLHAKPRVSKFGEIVEEGVIASRVVKIQE